MQGYIVALFYALVTLIGNNRMQACLPLLLCVVGAVSDTMGDSLQIFALPFLARSVDPSAATIFVVLDRLTIAWTGGLNNLWYGVAFFALAPLLRQSGFPTRFVMLVLIIGLVTILWGVASFFQHSLWLVITTAFSMMIFLFWTFDLGWYLMSRRNISLTK